NVNSGVRELPEPFKTNLLNLHKTQKLACEVRVLILEQAKAGFVASMRGRRGSGVSLLFKSAADYSGSMPKVNVFHVVWFTSEVSLLELKYLAPLVPIQIESRLVTFASDRC